MKQLLRKFLGLADSPSLHQDLVSLNSAWRIGFWFTIINATLYLGIGFSVFLSAFANDRLLTQITQHIGLGQFLACVLLCGIGVVSTILLPIRAAGLFEGPRWSRYFDQIVLSGISPARYFSGKLLAQNIFFLFMVVGAMPYAIFSLGLGGTSFSYVFTGLFLLWVYANIITLCTLVLTIFLHEILAVVLSIALFSGVAVAAGSPLPGVISMLSPAHCFMEPIYETLLAIMPRGGPPWQINGINIALGETSFELGNITLYLAGSAILASMAVAALMIGPVACLNKLNSTFGAVVMPGDSRKKRLFRRRFNIRRRSEISFFYENRFAWICRWEGLIRYGGLLLLMTMLAAISWGILHYVSAMECTPEDFYVANIVMFGCSLLVASYVFCRDIPTELTVQRVGSWSTTAGELSTLSFFLFALLVTILTVMVPEIRLRIEGTGWFRTYSWSSRSIDDRLTEALVIQRMIPLVILFAIEFYAVIRWFSLRNWTKRNAFIIAYILLSCLWFIPVGVYEATLHLDPEYKFVGTIAGVLTVFSPAPLFIAIIALTKISISYHFQELLEMNLHYVCLPVHILISTLAARLVVKWRQKLRIDQIGEPE